MDANARNKIMFTVSSGVATKLARHVAPFLDADDLSHRGAFQVTVRIVHHGHDRPPFTLDTLPLPAPVPGGAERLRAAARARTGPVPCGACAHRRTARWTPNRVSIGSINSRAVHPAILAAVHSAVHSAP